MNNKTTFLLIFCSVFFYCCNQKPKDNKSIYINLENNQKVSIFDIFSKIEVIPLETNDISLIKNISKLVVSNDTLFVLDNEMSKVLMFDKTGKYLSQINDKGMGPNEYSMTSDIDICDNTLILLSAINNKLYIYDKKGNFIKSCSLPTIKGAYNLLKSINKDTVALWTFDFDNRLKFYSKSTQKIFNEQFASTDNIFTNIVIRVFPYKTYLFQASDNRVFKIKRNSQVVEAYNWDFGKLNNTSKMIKNVPIVTSQEDMMKDINRLNSSKILNYYFIGAGGNSQYLYAKLYRENKQINIFYDKLSKKAYVFDLTTEKVKLFPLFWTDDYMIGFMPNVISDFNTIIPDDVLDADNIKRKNSLYEYDNPILVKYYFKKQP